MNLFREMNQKKLTIADEAVKVVKSGDKVGVGLNFNDPTTAPMQRSLTHIGEYGIPIGQMTLLDEVGHDVGAHVLTIMMKVSGKIF